MSKLKKAQKVRKQLFEKVDFFLQGEGEGHVRNPADHGPRQVLVQAESVGFMAASRSPGL